MATIAAWNAPSASPRAFSRRGCAPSSGASATAWPPWVSKPSICAKNTWRGPVAVALETTSLAIWYSWRAMAVVGRLFASSSGANAVSMAAKAVFWPGLVATMAPSRSDTLNALRCAAVNAVPRSCDCASAYSASMAFLRAEFAARFCAPNVSPGASGSTRGDCVSDRPKRALPPTEITGLPAASVTEARPPHPVRVSASAVAVCHRFCWSECE